MSVLGEKIMDEKQRKKMAHVPFKKVIKKHWMLLLMLAPAIIYVFVFSYIPMTGVVLAFKKYNFNGGIYGSPWNGLDNFKALLIAKKLGNVTRNTFLYNIIFIVLGTVFQVGSAILLNEVGAKIFKKTSQAFMFLPHFISWVVAGAIMYNVFSFERGIWNKMLVSLGGEPFDLYNTPGAWPFVLTFLKLWKGTGYGSVVSLAAITGIDQEMFEAASLDGANAWQKIRYLTIPSLVPTIVTLTLLAIGGIFRGDFGLFYQTVRMTAKLEPMTDVIDTYIFRLLMSSGNVSRSAAASLYQSILCFITINLANFSVKKIDPDYALY